MAVLALATKDPDWYEHQLRLEGMPPELPRIAKEYRLSPLANGYAHGRLGQLVRRVHARMEDAAAYHAVASDYLHRARWRRYPGRERRIWALHVDGLTQEEIGRRLGVLEVTVQKVIGRHLARAKRMAGL